MAGKTELWISNKKIEGIATRVREYFEERLGTGLRPREFLEKIVDALEGEIEVVASPEEIEAQGGSLTIYPTKEFVIRLSPYTAPTRDLFTIAHEIGHFFLHFNHKAALEKAINFHRYGSDRSEWQANRFAGALLMPEATVRSLIGKHGSQALWRIASHFGVSEKAVEVRLKSLDL